MLKDFVNRLGTMVKDRVMFDPSKFNDPIAMKTDWRPLKAGGSNFRTHKLVQVSDHRIEFKSSLGAKIFSLLFLVIGLSVMIFPTIGSISKGVPFLTPNFFMPLIFGLVFASIGFFLFKSLTKPIIFDKTLGYYWKGRVTPDNQTGSIPAKDCTQLHNIHAIQLISEYVRSDKSSYTSYELNLVLRSGQRLNVVDHGSSHTIEQNAQTLSDFLRCPVWSALASF